MKRATGVKKGRKAGRQKKTISLSASAEEPKRPYISLANVQRWYKPIKKPVTLRLDADVLAWFKKLGRGYQTRINRALRKVMEEKERKGAGE
jgi:uncharacterized protein (DUF4415 family)